MVLMWFFVDSVISTRAQAKLKPQFRGQISKFFGRIALKDCFSFN